MQHMSRGQKLLVGRNRSAGSNERRPIWYALLLSGQLYQSWVILMNSVICSRRSHSGAQFIKFVMCLTALDLLQRSWSLRAACRLDCAAGLTGRQGCASTLRKSSCKSPLTSCVLCFLSALKHPHTIVFTHPLTCITFCLPHLSAFSASRFIFGSLLLYPKRWM